MALAQPFRGALFHRAREVAVTGVGVQQGALGRLAQQRLVRVLAVDVDEQGAQCRAVLQRGSAAVDIGAAAALGGDYPAQDALAAGVVGFTRV